MKKTFLVALLLCGDALATQSASSVTPPVDVDAIAREMAIKARDENDALRARIEALEAKLSATND